MKTVEEQFAEISATFSGATLTPAGGGMHLVRIHNMPLPEGWSQPSTEIRFIVPSGYPYAAPDCFWADMALRLRGGGMPKNATVGQTMPGQTDSQTLWFSWHVNTAWNPSCTLSTYVKVIRKRFEALQ
jgi:hypothetical protein